MQEPIDVTVLRAGIPDTVPGRSVNMCERGIAAMLAGELVPGETVEVEVRLPSLTKPLLTSATVKYQDKLRCGFEFLAISPEQRSAIRDWAKEARSETEVNPPPPAPAEPAATKTVAPRKEARSSGPSQNSNRPKRDPRWIWVTGLVVLAIAAAIFWWRWNRGWDDLESGLAVSENSSAEKSKVQVPTEVMQKLLVHRVPPVYPLEARKDNLQGIIALDIVVARDGSVIRIKALNGPEILARAAMDSLRWWKFEPYRVNGEAVPAETTMAVEFKQ